MFESTRAKICKTYNEAEALTNRTRTIELLTDHFIGHPDEFIWLDGSIKDFPDPRMYFNQESKIYDYEGLKKDIRKIVIVKQSELVSGSLEDANKLEYIQQRWLSRYAEYMYTKGYSEVPGASDIQREKIKMEFYNLWGSSDEVGFYWKWQTLNQERVEQERQKLLERLVAEEAVRKYLEDKEREAVVAMITGGAGTVSGVIVMIVFPPSSIAIAAWSVAGISYSAATFVQGVSQFKAIQDGIFDPNKKYNIIEGVLCSISDEYGSLFFDLTTIVIGIRTIKGNYINIKDLKTLTGNELKAIVAGLNSGASTIEVGGQVYELMQVNK